MFTDNNITKSSTLSRFTNLDAMEALEESKLAYISTKKHCLEKYNPTSEAVADLKIFIMEGKIYKLYR